MPIKLNPGSQTATHAGCSCPIWDNRSGHGIPSVDGSKNFYIDDNCPLHGKGKWKSNLNKRRKPAK